MDLVSPAQLRRAGVLGMNMRNVDYISGYNDRRRFPLVDDKLKSKRIAEAAGMAVPKLLHVVNYQYNLKSIGPIIDQWDEFVIKPAQGSGGKGILVITGREGEDYLKPSGAVITMQDLRRHISNILSGLHSLGGRPDVAMIESLIHFDPIFSDYTFEGVPDIRIIVFRGFPVMAMLRLSTHASDGKANLHQGAVGVGIDLASGKSLRAVQHDQLVTHHPDTGSDFSQLAIPHWRQMMELAASCYDVTGLGYLGADIVIDRERGPLVLEMNARPGLAIQIANGIGLAPRLSEIEGLEHVDLPVAERVDYAMSAFSRQ